jgi:hypothetical protein
MEVTHMVVEEAARKAADENSTDAANILELRYIADTLEAIRGELVGLAHIAGAIAQKPSPR